MGHGWVKPNASGAVARCGGPALCPDCQKEQAELEAPAKVVNRSATRPSIGRAVHYQDAKFGTCAATIAGINVNSEADECVLYVIRNRIPEADQDGAVHVIAEFSPEPLVGHWSWPPRI